jgi:hypothetical protein
LHTTTETLIQSGELKVGAAVRDQLSPISSATIDRLLAGEKKKQRVKGRRLTKGCTLLLKYQIPIRAFRQRHEKKAGFLEINTVGHEGNDPHRDFALTLDATDVATGCMQQSLPLNLQSPPVDTHAHALPHAGHRFG